MKKTIKLSFYYFSKILGLFYISRILTRRKPRILCYHGGSIGDECNYNGLLFITRSVFEKRMEWLKNNNFEFTSLNNAISSSNNEKRNKPLVALTFDDGWFSTLSELFPILFKNAIPSTLYLSTKNFQDGAPIVPVTLGYIFHKSILSSIEISEINEHINGRYDFLNAASRIELVNRVTEWIEKCAPANEDVIKTINNISECAGFSSNDLDLVSRRFNYISPTEVVSCSKKGCSIELHGHIHNYPKGDKTKFDNDLNKCINVIENLSLPRPRHYCYPSGNYDLNAADVLQKQNILSATTCIPGLVGDISGMKVYFLPRFLDGEKIHMLEFEAEMMGFSEILRTIFRMRRVF